MSVSTEDAGSIPSSYGEGYINHDKQLIQINPINPVKILFYNINFLVIKL